MHQSTTATTQMHAAPSVESRPASQSSPTSKPPPSPATSPRAAKTAKFIAAEAADTTVHLGQDGQLPSLVLEESKAKEESDEEHQKSSPFLMVAVLCVSLGASVAMLLLDTEARRSEREDKEQARRMIEEVYTPLQPGQVFLAPYQEDLRAALQAHNRDDYATERKLYRRVISRLKAENNSELKGLTGQVRAQQPPNDEHLEQLLSTLLRSD